MFVNCYCVGRALLQLQFVIIKVPALMVQHWAGSRRCTINPQTHGRVSSQVIDGSTLANHLQIFPQKTGNRILQKPSRNVTFLEHSLAMLVTNESKRWENVEKCQIQARMSIWRKGFSSLVTSAKSFHLTITKIWCPQTEMCHLYRINPSVNGMRVRSLVIYQLCIISIC